MTERVSYAPVDENPYAQFTNRDHSDLTPLVEHSQNNINNSKYYTHPDGRISTIYSSVIESDDLNEGRPTLIPLVWDGTILDADEAIKRARESGVTWPSFQSVGAGELASHKAHELVKHHQPRNPYEQFVPTEDEELDLGLDEARAAELPAESEIPPDGEEDWQFWQAVVRNWQGGKLGTKAFDRIASAMNEMRRAQPGEPELWQGAEPGLPGFMGTPDPEKLREARMTPEEFQEKKWADIANWLKEAEGFHKESGKYPVSPEVMQMMEAENMGELLANIKNAPIELIVEISARSGYHSLRMLPLAALMTAAGGPVGPAMGGIALGQQSASLERNASIIEALMQEGIDVFDSDQLFDALQDQEMVDRIRADAEKRAATIGTMDAITFGLATRYLGPRQLRGKVIGELINLVYQLGIQMTGGGGGEALAQVAEKGKITAPGEIAAEVLGEFGGGVIEPAVGRVVGAAAREAGEAAGRRFRDVPEGGDAPPGPQLVGPDDAEVLALPTAPAEIPIEQAADVHPQAPEATEDGRRVLPDDAGATVEAPAIGGEAVEQPALLPVPAAEAPAEAFVQPPAPVVAEPEIVPEPAAEPELRAPGAVPQRVERPEVEAIPEPIFEYPFPQLRRLDYRQALEDLKGQITPGGEIVLVPDFDKMTAQQAASYEPGDIVPGAMTRTPSVNPPWFQGLADDTGVSVKRVGEIIDKALAGGMRDKQGKRRGFGKVERQVIEALIGVVEDQRKAAALEGKTALRDERRELRRGKPLADVGIEPVGFTEAENVYQAILEAEEAGRAEAPVVRPEPKLEEVEYPPDWDQDTRSLMDLAAAASEVASEDEVDTALEAQSDIEAARKLQALIDRGPTREREPTKPAPARKEPVEAPAEERPVAERQPVEEAEFEYHERVEKIRAAVSPEDEKKVIAKHPLKPEDIGRRNVKENYLDKIPKTKKSAINKLNKIISKAQESRRDRIRKYQNLQRDGVGGVSDYDVMISSGERPLQALDGALTLIENQISYDQEIIAQAQERILELTGEKRVHALKPPTFELEREKEGVAPPPTPAAPPEEVAPDLGVVGDLFSETANRQVDLVQEAEKSAKASEVEDIEARTKPEPEVKHEPGAAPVSDTDVESAAEVTEHVPSEKQKESDLYRKGEQKIHGLRIQIENQKGSYRYRLDLKSFTESRKTDKRQDAAIRLIETGEDPIAGFSKLKFLGKTAAQKKALKKRWIASLAAHYGQILGYRGKDKDYIDVFLGDKAADIDLPVFVFDQRLPGQVTLDEHKVMMGFETEVDAMAAYLGSYDKGAVQTPEVTQMTIGQFKDWLETADKTKPAKTTFKPKGAAVARKQPVYTLEKHGKISKQIQTGEIKLAELKKNFAALAESESAIKAELATKTVKQLAPSGAGGLKKAEVIDRVYHNMLQRFSVKDGFTWSPFTESFKDALTRVVDETTQEDIDAAAERRRKNVAEWKESLSDPKTISDFQNFVSVRGENALTDEQKARYDELRAAREKEQRAAVRKEAKGKIAKVELGEVSMSVTETVHTQKGHALWVVRLDERVDRDTFTTLRNASKKLGGYYSRYARDGAIPGFQFRTPEAADKFMEVAKGDVSAVEELEQKDALVQGRAVKRLRDMADKMKEQGQASLDQDRKENTVRRARMAASAEGAAHSKIALAETMINLANAIEKGDATHLDGIKHRTHIERLHKLSSRAHSDANRARGLDYEKYKELPVVAEDMATAKWPELDFFTDIIRSINKTLKEKPKTGTVVKQLESRLRVAANLGEEKITLPEKLVRDVIKKLGKEHVGWQLRDQIEEIDQLNAMGIYSEPVLRTALREYVQYREGPKKADPIKEAERKLVGIKIQGFFPTPPTILRRMMGIADIEHTDRVLEPSAGKGNILDAVFESTPGLPKENVDAIEIVPSLQDIIKKKGYEVSGGDFLMYADEKGYDKIVMNPPFEKGADIAHVKHAFEMLKPGGRLVAIMSEGPFFRDTKDAKEFRQMVSEYGHSEKLAEGSFKDAERATGVNTRIVMLEKPDDYSFIIGKEPARKAVPLAALGAHVASIQSLWPLAPEIKIVTTLAGFPIAAQYKVLRSGTQDRVRGLYHRSANIIYLLQPNIESLARAERVIFHEVGHFATPAEFGEEYQTFLGQVFLAYGKSGLQDVIDNYAIDVSTRQGREKAAHEKLGRIAEDVWRNRADQKARNLWDKFIALINRLLRKWGFRSKMSHAEIRTTVLRSRKNVTRPAPSKAGLSAREIAEGKYDDSQAYALKDEPERTALQARKDLSDFDADLRAAAEENKRRSKQFLERLKYRSPIELAFRKLFTIFDWGRIDEKGIWHLNPKFKLYAKASVQLAGEVASRRFQFLQPLFHSARRDMVERYGLDDRLKDLGGIYTKLTKAIQFGLIDRYGQTKEYKEIARRALQKEREVVMEMKDILKDLEHAGVDVDEAKILHKVMTGEPVTDEDLDAMQALATPIMQAIDMLGQEAVELGQLSREAYERNRGKYLHRTYTKHELDAQGSLIGWINKYMSDRRKRIIGDQYKARGIFDYPTVKQLTRTQSPEWWNQRRDKKGDIHLFNMYFHVFDRMSYTPGEGTADLIPAPNADRFKRPRVLERVYWPGEEPIPNKYKGWQYRGLWEVRDVKGEQVTLWRDFSSEEREQLGEILDARYNIAKTFLLMARDLASGKLFKDIAENGDWAVKVEPVDIAGKPLWTEAKAGKHKLYVGYEWVKVPSTRVPGTKTYRYGALAGMYVRTEIWIDINEAQMMHAPKVWRSILTNWKLNKTARSPVVHMNNIMSNVMLAELSDIRSRDMLLGLMSWIEQDEHYQDAVRHGVFGSDFVSQEANRNILKPMLREIVRQNQNINDDGESNISFIGKLLTMIANMDRAMINAYQAEDEIFRMGLYMRKLSLGYTPEASADMARKQFIDYDIRAPWVNALRNSVLPFLAYAYRAIPIVGQSLADRPWKWVKIATLAYMANYMFYLLMDDDDEEDQRRLMNERLRGKTWLGTPRMIRMPMNDEYGNPIFLDVRRWIPAGDIQDLHQYESAVPIPPWLFPSGPMSLGAEIALNKEAYTTREIYNPLIDTAGERTAKVGKFLWRSWVPSAPWIPGSWYQTKIWQTWKGGQDPLGRQYSVPMAVMSSVGVKLHAEDPTLQMGYQNRYLMAVQRALEDEFNRAAREYRRNLINERTYKTRQKIIKEKLEILAQERRRVLAGQEPED